MPDPFLQESCCCAQHFRAGWFRALAPDASHVEPVGGLAELAEEVQ